MVIESEAAPAASGSKPKGFRPTSRRRARIAGGAALAAIAIGGNVLLYTSLDSSTEVVQLVHAVRAGELVTRDDVRIVEADLDPTVPVLPADQLDTVLNQYARVFLAANTLMMPQLVQPKPLITPGAAVVAVEIRAGQMPANLHERSAVQLVVVGRGDETFVTTGRVVARSADADAVSGTLSLSVEVDQADAAIVAAGDDVRVVLLDPGVDPAMAQGAG